MEFLKSSLACFKSWTERAFTKMHLCAVVATNNVRLSRRDQEQSPPGKTKKHLAAASSTSQVTPPPLATKTQLNYNTTTRRRMTSMEPKKVRNKRKTCN